MVKLRVFMQDMGSIALDWLGSNLPVAASHKRRLMSERDFALCKAKASPVGRSHTSVVRWAAQQPCIR